MCRVRPQRNSGRILSKDLTSVVLPSQGVILAARWKVARSANGRHPGGCCVGPGERVVVERVERRGCV